MTALLLALTLAPLLASPSALTQSVDVDPIVSVDAWEVPWPDTRPRDPYVDPQGRAWFNGQTGNYPAFLDPADGSFERFELPTRTGPHNLIVDDDGAVAEWPLPSGPGSAPYGTALDHRGRIWIAETGPFPNRLVAFDPTTETFVADREIEVGGSARHLMFDPATRQIWFGVDTGFVVRVQVSV